MIEAPERGELLHTDGWFDLYLTPDRTGFVVLLRSAGIWVRYSRDAARGLGLVFLEAERRMKHLPPPERS